MNVSQQIAKNLRDVYFGGNWTAVNLKDTLKDINWQQAVTKVYDLNTIATIVFHSNYYIGVALRVLHGGPLEGKDEESFKLPPINSQDDWENLLNRIWTEVEGFAKQIEQLPESKLGEVFGDEKYGSYFRNLEGIVEHTHYHLGQIVLIKKIIQHEPYGRH
jgi:hypothetical protein